MTTRSCQRFVEDDVGGAVDLGKGVGFEHWQVALLLGAGTNRATQRMERPNLDRRTALPLTHPVAQLLRGAAVKGGGENLLRWKDPFLHQSANAVGHCRRLAGAGHGKDQCRAFVMGNNGALLRRQRNGRAGCAGCRGLAPLLARMVGRAVTHLVLRCCWFRCHIAHYTVAQHDCTFVRAGWAQIA